MVSTKSTTFTSSTPNGSPPRPTGANAANCRSGGHPPVSPQAGARTLAPREGLASASSAAPRPMVAPSPATIERYPALAGRPDLTNHLQVVEAIGYHDLALRLSKRARWTRAERAAIAAATAKVVAEARESHQLALRIWSDIQKARGLQALADAQDAAMAAEERAA